jgi:trehalose 6-phosphate phosphatase
MELRSALDSKDELTRLIERAPQLLLCLDFDGTLSPIVERPALAELPPATGRVLKDLQALPSIALSFVSGRLLEDIKSRVGLEAVVYAGNHGLEIEGSGSRFDHPDALRLAADLRDLAGRLAAGAADLEGVEIEDKGLTTSVHHRRASATTRRRLLGLLRELVPASDGRFVVREGLMVYEVRPRVAWDKGQAIRWIRDRLGLSAALPIVLGDDVTDEDAFVAFDDALTICINPRRPTAARYCLTDPDEVRQFLAWIAQIWRGVGLPEAHGQETSRTVTAPGQTRRVPS